VLRGPYVITEAGGGEEVSAILESGRLVVTTNRRFEIARGRDPDGS
jgi:hypothetical protein